MVKKEHSKILLHPNADIYHASVNIRLHAPTLHTLYFSFGYNIDKVVDKSEILFFHSRLQNLGWSLLRYCALRAAKYYDQIFFGLSLLFKIAKIGECTK